MSKYKDQIKAKLADKTILTDKVLSIGAQEDDRNYFKHVQVNEWLTLDVDAQFRPNIIFDMNKSIDTEAGYGIPTEYVAAFDMVIALNLFEYIYDPYTAVKNLRDLLAPKGTLLVNFPFVYPLHKPEGTDFLRYTPEGVEKLLKLVGLTIVEHSYIYGDELLLDFYHADGLKARKGFDHKIIGSIVEARKG